MATHTQAQLDYIRKYEKENVKQYRLRFNKVYDADVIAKIEEQPNKIDYIRGLIKQDILRSKPYKTRTKKSLYKPRKN